MNTIQKIMSAVAATASPWKYNQVLASLSRGNMASFVAPVREVKQ